jgi:hypothetical protein
MSADRWASTRSSDMVITESVLGRSAVFREERGMSIRRMGAVLALSTMAIVGTATAAAARDYPPTTGSVSTDAANVTATTGASAVTEPGASSSSGSLPFTGGNDVQLVWIGAACAGAGALAVVKSRRSHRRA